MDDKELEKMSDEELKKFIREFYARIAENSCGCSCAGCCSNTADECWPDYSEEELSSIPEEANLGLGCGNPLLFAEIREGQTVLDLGCGAGYECFVASRRVGPRGQVIGVDMTPEMIEKARKNATAGGFPNVKFILAEIENLPLPDESVDLVISNCVINLSPDKERVFREAFRVLRPGGKLAISDVVLTRELPEEIKNDLTAYAGCLSGAEMKTDYLNLIEKAGFTNVEVKEQAPYFLSPPEGGRENQGAGLTGGAESSEVLALSIIVTAKKP